QQEETFGRGGPWTLPKVRSAINEGRTVSAGVLEARANDSAQRASKPARAGTRLAAPRRRAARRGSGGPYAPARLTPPSLPLAQQSTGVYIPPPVSNPGAQINQLNQSFQDRNTLRLRLDVQGDPSAFEPGMTVWFNR